MRRWLWPRSRRRPERNEAPEAGLSETSPPCLIVDGMNLIGSRPDGWWRDRPAAWRRLARELERYAQESGEQVVLVLDGRRPAGWEDRVETVFAGGARNAADDAIVARVDADPDRSRLEVVSSDRELERRVRGLGATVLSASSFRRRLDRMVDG